MIIPEQLHVLYGNNKLYYQYNELVPIVSNCLYPHKRGPKELLARYHLEETDQLLIYYGGKGYIGGELLSRFLTNDSSKIRDHVLRGIGNNEQLHTIFSRLTKLVTIVNTQTVQFNFAIHGTQHSIPESIHKKPHVYQDITSEYKNQMKYEKTNMTKEFYTVDSIQEFLKGPVFSEHEEEINIYEHFRLVSGQNQDLYIRPSPNRRFSRKKLTEYKTGAQVRERVREALTGFQKLCESAHQKFEWYLDKWFQLRPSDFIFFVKSFMKSKKNFQMLITEIEKSKGRHLVEGLPKADFIAYIKERLSLSGVLYDFRLWSEIDNILPSRGEVDEVTEEYNRKCWETLKIEYNHGGLSCCLETLIEYIVKSHEKEQHIREQLGLPFVLALPKTIEFKVSMDSRTIDHRKSVVMCIVPLNLVTFNPQNREIAIFP